MLKDQFGVTWVVDVAAQYAVILDAALEVLAEVGEAGSGAVRALK